MNSKVGVWVDHREAIVVRISESGEEVIRVQSGAESQLRRGVVSMTHLYGSLAPSADPYTQRGSHTGRLTSLQKYLEPINFMPRFSGIPVNIRRAAVAS